MRYAIVENNLVVNVAVSDVAIESNWVASDKAQVGDCYLNGEFSKPTPNREAESISVRAHRNRKLAESDWTQAKDIPDTVSTSWAAYRQALRDVPAQEGFPWDVEWPEAPAA